MRKKRALPEPDVFQSRQETKVVIGLFEGSTREVQY
jgi:hypothetical protein